MPLGSVKGRLHRARMELIDVLRRPHAVAEA